MKSSIKRESKITEILFDIIFSFIFFNIVNTLFFNYHTESNFSLLLSFSILGIIVINSWHIEMIHINRYGKNSLINIFFMLLIIGILITLYNTLDVTHWLNSFKWITLFLALLSLILTIQHTIQYYIVTDAIEKKITEPFIYILSGRTLGLLIAVFLPLTYSLVFILISFFTSWLLPSFISRSLHAKTIIFNHIVQRCSYFIIGQFLTIFYINLFAKDYNIENIIKFIIVCSLFGIYQLSIERFINKNITNQSGNSYLYHNYFIIFGLMIFSISLEYFTYTVLYSLLGIFVYLLGILAQNQYNKKNLKYSRNFIIGSFLAILGGYFINLMLLSNIVTIFIVVFSLMVSTIIFYVKNNN